MFRTARLVTTLVLLAGCGRQPPAATTPATPTSVDNVALGLRLAALPEGVTVAVNQGPRLALDARAGSTRGTATIELRATASSSVNLVAEAKTHGETAAAEGGKFFGGNELVTPYGAAYTVRVLVDRGLVEERAVFLLHPDGSGRLLVVRLRYPPGDNEAVRLRMLQALELVGTLEPLAAPAGG